VAPALGALVGSVCFVREELSIGEQAMDGHKPVEPQLYLGEGEVAHWLDLDPSQLSTSRSIQVCRVDVLCVLFPDPAAAEGSSARPSSHDDQQELAIAELECPQTMVQSLQHTVADPIESPLPTVFAPTELLPIEHSTELQHSTEIPPNLHQAIVVVDDLVVEAVLYAWSVAGWAKRSPLPVAVGN
jgi:hypothetical protein